MAFVTSSLYVQFTEGEGLLTENVPKTLSKAPCLVAKRMSLALLLLLFKQSM